MTTSTRTSATPPIHTDQYTRRIIGFGVHRGIVDGVGLCRMFKRAIRCQTVRKYLFGSRSSVSISSMAGNLRVLGVTEIKTVPYVPMSHPFVERLIGTIRREYLDVALFWTAVDLESKLSEFRDYFIEVTPVSPAKHRRNLLWSTAARP